MNVGIIKKPPSPLLENCLFVFVTPSNNFKKFFNSENNEKGIDKIKKIKYTKGVIGSYYNSANFSFKEERNHF